MCEAVNGEKESWADSQLSPEREVRAADTSLESTLVSVCAARTRTVCCECGLCERRWQELERRRIQRR